jgi:Fe-S-cluster containining protein
MEERDNLYGEDIERLNLGKYGLPHLEGANLLALDRPDMDRLLAALGDDDISLNLPIPCTAENVAEVLAYSECRRCGRCCRPNPLNPKSPGVEVFEEELQAMAEYAHLPYQEVRQKTTRGNTTPYAFQAVKLGFTRWLPLPCPFYAAGAGCQAYPVRAVVCRTYPIIFTEDDTCISVRTTCDYGRDLVVAACARLRKNDPGLEIKL